VRATLALTASLALLLTTSGCGALILPPIATSEFSEVESEASGDETSGDEKLGDVADAIAPDDTKPLCDMALSAVEEISRIMDRSSPVDPRDRDPYYDEWDSQLAIITSAGIAMTDPYLGRELVAYAAAGSDVVDALRVYDFDAGNSAIERLGQHQDWLEYCRQLD
jgi:hypothetical protein